MGLHNYSTVNVQLDETNIRSCQSNTRLIVQLSEQFRVQQWGRKLLFCLQVTHITSICKSNSWNSKSLSNTLLCQCSRLVWGVNTSKAPPPKTTNAFKKLCCRVIYDWGWTRFHTTGVITSSVTELQTFTACSRAQSTITDFSLMHTENRSTGFSLLFQWRQLSGTGISTIK